MVRSPLGLAWVIVLGPAACVPAPARVAGNHPASAEAAAAPLPRAAEALGPRYAADAGPAEPAILEDEPSAAHLPGAGVAPSRPLATDADAGAEGHHGH
jgi:hypothetical protein